jgi:hypothetical protein
MKEWAMAYDRYDNRGGRGGWRDNDRDHRSGGERNERGFFERAREEVSSWFGDEESGNRRMEDDRSRGRDNMNWSRGEQSHGGGRYGHDEGSSRYGSQNRDRGMFGSADEPWGRGRDENRYGAGRSGMDRDDYRSRGFGQDRDQDRFGRGREQARGGMFSHEDDRDHRERRSGSRDRGYPGTLGQSAHQDRGYGDPRGSSGHDDGYRPITGDYGRGGDQGGQGSGMGGQDFARSQYGRQDFSQDQDRDRNYGGQTYNYGGWGDRESQQQNSRGAHPDDHYSQWRQRQMQELDRDYHDYRREHQSKFENEFSGWRQQKQTKRQMLQSIREHMEVVDENGEHIGTVDKVHGDTVILTRNDPSAGGVHRSFGCSLLSRVEDKVYLSGSAATIRHQLHEERDDNRGRGGSSAGGGIFGGLFGGGRSDEDRKDERLASTSTNQPQGEGPHVLDRSFSGTYDDKK